MNNGFQKQHIVGVILGAVVLAAVMFLGTNNAPAGAQTACTAPPSGMVAWWPGDGNADDIQGTNNATLQNGATFATGEVGQAFSLDGKGNYITAPNSSNWEFGANDFTIEFWLYKVANTHGYIARDGTTLFSPWIIGSLLGSTDRVYMTSNGSTWDIANAQSMGTIPINTWTHIAVTRSGSTFTAYNNGNIASTWTSSAALAPNSNPLSIGRVQNNTDFNGRIDELGIYNRALLQSEIQAIVNAGTAGKCKESAPPPTQVCGNGVVESGEQCDDGNTTNGDGCSSVCQTEACVPVPTSSFTNVLSHPEFTDIPGLAYGPNAAGQNVIWVGSYLGTTAWPSGNIIELNPTTGAVITQHASLGWGGSGPGSIAYDSTSVGGPYLLIASYNDRAVYKVRITDFTLASSFPVGGFCGRPLDGIAFDGTNLWLSCPEVSSVKKITTAGTVLASYPGIVYAGLEYFNGYLFVVRANVIEVRDTNFALVKQYAFSDSTGLNGELGSVDPATGDAFWGMRGLANLRKLHLIDTCEAPLPPTPVCGNSVIETGEQCDDGNAVSGDGCSNSCQFEAPETTLTATPAAVTKSNAATFEFTSNREGVLFECSLDAGAYAACASPKLYSGLVDGTHIFTVRAKDAYGNTDLTPATFSWVIETVPPVAVITYPAEGQTIDPDVSGTIKDEGGFEDGVPLGGEPLEPDDKGLFVDEGLLFVEVPSVIPPPPEDTVIDVILPSDEVIDFTTGCASPCRLTGGVWGGVPLTNITNINQADGTTNFRAEANGRVVKGKINTYGGLVAVSGLADRIKEVRFTHHWAKGALSDGAYTYQLTAIDAAGNRTTATRNFHVLNDVIPPTITNNPIPAATNNPALTLSGTVTDSGTGVQNFTINGAPVTLGAGGSYSYAVTLTEGQNSFTEVAKDMAGNTELAIQEITLDTVAPDTMVTASPSSPTASTDASFSFTSSEAGSTFECSLDAGAYAACASPKSYSGLVDGTHIFTVRAKDSIGNTDASPASVSWQIVIDDGDGIDWDVDTDRLNFSNDFDTRPLGGSAYGTVTNRGGFTVHVGHTVTLDVRVDVSGVGSKAKVRTCDNQIITEYDAGESTELACGSMSTTIGARAGTIRWRKPPTGKGTRGNVTAPDTITIVGDPVVTAAAGNTSASLVEVVDENDAVVAACDLKPADSLSASPVNADGIMTLTNAGSATIACAVDGATIALPPGAIVVDQCSGLGGNVGGTGCPVADKNIVLLHNVYIGGGTSSKAPLAGAFIRVFDRNNANFQAVAGGKNPDGSLYGVIYEANAGRVGQCVTGSDGICFAGEKQVGDYLVIVKYADGATGKTVYVGRPKSPTDFADTNGDGAGDLATKDFQIMKVYKNGAFQEYRGGSKMVITGSMLEMIAPAGGIWESAQSIYPFIFTSDSDWAVDVCAQVPAGYALIGAYDETGALIASTECAQALVANQVKVVAFEVREVGSPEPEFTATVKLKNPKGKVTELKVKASDLRRAAFEEGVKSAKAVKEARDRKAKGNGGKIRLTKVGASLWSIIRDVFGLEGRDAEIMTVGRKIARLNAIRVPEWGVMEGEYDAGNLPWGFALDLDGIEELRLAP